MVFKSGVGAVFLMGFCCLEKLLEDPFKVVEIVFFFGGTAGSSASSES